jgi:hypothetical protein
MLNFPVYVLMLFVYGEGITGAFWPYSYNTATNYIVKDSAVCNLAAQSFGNATGQHGYCIKVNTYEEVNSLCGEKVQRPCILNLPNTTRIGGYGQVFWKPTGAPKDWPTYKIANRIITK